VLTVGGLEPDSRAGGCTPGPPPELAAPAGLAAESTVEEAFESIPLGVTVGRLVVDSRAGECTHGPPKELADPARLAVESPVEETLESIPLRVTVEQLAGACMCIAHWSRQRNHRKMDLDH